jgi:hypothetical protein
MSLSLVCAYCQNKKRRENQVEICAKLSLMIITRLSTSISLIFHTDKHKPEREEEDSSLVN